MQLFCGHWEWLAVCCLDSHVTHIRIEIMLQRSFLVTACSELCASSLWLRNAVESLVIWWTLIAAMSKWIICLWAGRIGPRLCLKLKDSGPVQFRCTERWRKDNFIECQWCVSRSTSNIIRERSWSYSSPQRAHPILRILTGMLGLHWACS